MKNRIFTQLSWGMVVTTLLAASALAQDAASTAAVLNNAATPEVAAQTLENAPGKIVSTPAATHEAITPLEPAAEIVKLAQAGVDESVMLAFVTNSAHKFNLGSDQIIYLTDIGVPNSVVTSMLQHDQILSLNAQSVPTPTPVYSSTPPAPASVETQPTPPSVVEEIPPAPNVSCTYFYDSLSPYGNWIDIEGCGLCWQPTVVSVNPGWQPYCDRGHWLDADCGWYWASDYSWGWAPFHYGRWFRHHRWGWCWAPDTVWAPAWVSWRYNDAFCGWAPLPPTACFRPGFGFSYFGRSVGFDFSFGLDVDCFSFVPIGFFCDAHPWRHRLPLHDAGAVFNHTVPSHEIVESNHGRIHKGIPSERVAAATHTTIRQLHLQETTDFEKLGRGERIEGNGRTLTVFHPNLPEPAATHKDVLVGGGVKPALPDSPALRGTPGFERGISKPAVGKGIAPQPFRHSESVPVFKNAFGSPGGSAPLPTGHDSSHFVQPASVPVQNPVPGRDHLSGLIVNQHATQYPTPAQQPQAIAPPRTTLPYQNLSGDQRNYRLEPPRNWENNQRTVVAPAAPTPPVAPAWNSPAPSVLERHDQPRWSSPAPVQNIERTLPQRQAETVIVPPARTAETYQHSTPPPQPSAPPSQNSGQSHQDNKSGGNPHGGR